MALRKDQFYSGPTTKGPNKRVHVEKMGPRTFATDAGAATVVELTPLVEASGEWSVWQDADANTIQGFLINEPDGLLLSATEEVLGNVMLAGRIHAADVVLPAGQTQNTLDTALRHVSLRNLGIFVQGLDGVA